MATVSIKLRIPLETLVKGTKEEYIKEVVKLLRINISHTRRLMVKQILNKFHPQLLKNKKL